MAALLELVAFFFLLPFTLFPCYSYFSLLGMLPPLQETTWSAERRVAGSGLTFEPSGMQGSELKLGVGHALTPHQKEVVL
jgi:hypothetical protein